MTFNCLQRLKSSFSLFPFSFSKLSLSSLSSQLPSKTNHLKEDNLMSLCKKCNVMRDLKQIHAHIIRSGFDQNLFLVSRIIVFCAISEHGDMDYAVSVFEKTENPDGFLWNTMIRGFGRNDQPHFAFDYFKTMREKGEVVDNFTFSFLLKISGQLGSVLLGEQMHSSTVKLGLESHVFVRNTLIHMYGLFRDIDTACQLFEEIPSPDLVAWTTIIDSHVYCGKCNEALDLFLCMLRSRIEPDEATLVVTVSACSQLGALDFGRWVHSWISSTNFGEILSINNALIDMYAKCGSLEEAYKAFNWMKEKNIVSWNTMILGLASHGYADEALALFSKMSKEKLETPDAVTFLGVLCACSHGGMIEEGRRYFDAMTKVYNIEPTVKHYGCMVDILGRAGLVEEAYGLIKSTPIECSAIVWRTLLAACRIHGNVEIGVEVRRNLLEVEPDHSSDYVLLANMYAGAGQWNEVMKVRNSMQDRGVQKPQPGNSCLGYSS